MVRMNHDQRTVIASVQDAREAYKRQAAAIDAEARVRKQQAKSAVIAAIRNAEQMGVPRNRIAVEGMGYTGTAPLNSFMADALEEVVASPVISSPNIGAGSGAHTFGAITWKLKESRVANHLNVLLDNANQGTWLVEMDKRDDGVWVVNETEFLEVEWANELQDVQAALSAAAGGTVVFEQG